MHNRLVAVLFWVVYLCTGISAADDIKKGTYPFMGFLYYQDESIADATGARFIQGVVLIRPEFLISSTVVGVSGDDPLSKTLLARLGAARIDPKFTFNEDEDEQEQEVVQVITPTQHNDSHWWASDISLLKTLQPFKETSAVRVTQLSTKRTFDKTCDILAFKKSEGGMFLTKYAVEMLPPSVMNCGNNFEESTMACAGDPPTIADEKGPENFCRGISGGPLLCENDVMALQTYINGDCKSPHLYQLVAPWKNFLSCGTKEQCDDMEKCPNMCTVTLKDSPLTENVTSASSISEAVSEESSPKEETASSEETSSKEEPASSEDALSKEEPASLKEEPEMAEEAAPPDHYAKIEALTMKVSKREKPTNITKLTKADSLDADYKDIEVPGNHTINGTSRFGGLSKTRKVYANDGETVMMSIVPILNYTNVANKNGISGGPLLCENDVMALQTYINGNCKSPHLYQLLAPWKNFLTCGTEEQCDDKEKCPNICTVTLKDSPSTENVTSASSVLEAVTEESSPKEETASSEETSTTEEPSTAEESATTEEAVASEDFAKFASAFKASEEGSGAQAANVTEKNATTLKEQKTDIEALRTAEGNSTVNGTKLKEARLVSANDEDDEVSEVSGESDPSVNGNTNVMVIQGLIYGCFFMWICIV